jgi:hypothetical protein
MDLSIVPDAAMLGFKSFSSAAVTLAAIDMVHRFAFDPAPTLKEQFEANPA